MMKQERNMNVYRGFPMDAKHTLEELVEEGCLTLVEPSEDGTYRLDAGVYSGHIEDKDAYHILKVLSDYNIFKKRLFEVF